MDFPKSVPGIGLVNDRFVDENPSTGQIGSLIPAAWMNSVTLELTNVLRRAGLEPDEASSEQLGQAIDELIAKKIDGKLVRALSEGRQLTADDMGLLLLDASGASGTYTLPRSDAELGIRDVILRRTDAGPSPLIVQVAGTDRLLLGAEGAGEVDVASVPLAKRGEWVCLRSDGAGRWWCVGASFQATEARGGVLRLGTQAEIDAGESAAVAVTPRTLMKGAGIHRRAGFFESGTWLCPPGVTRINATGCGAGGGGGGATAASTVHGQGGGAGASAFCVSLDVTPGMTYMVSIGTAGAGGAVGSNGSAGGASSIGSLLTLPGGAGGLATGSGSGGGGGAPAPIAPGTSRGGNGADGPTGGHGGSSSFGGGGSARQSAGSAGAGWGSGGAGGRPGNNGGPGADGFLILEW